MTISPIYVLIFLQFIINVLAIYSWYLIGKNQSIQKDFFTDDEFIELQQVAKTNIKMKARWAERYKTKVSK